MSKKIDYLKYFYSKAPNVNGVKDAEVFNKEVEGIIIPFMRERLEDVFETVSIKPFKPKKLADTEKVDGVYDKGNFLLVQAVELHIDGELAYLPFFKFKSFEDLDENLEDVVIDLFD